MTYALRSGALAHSILCLLYAAGLSLRWQRGSIVLLMSSLADYGLTRAQMFMNRTATLLASDRETITGQHSHITSMLQGSGEECEEDTCAGALDR